MTLLSAMEINRWRRARLFLLNTIELLSSELRAERNGNCTASDKIKTLEHQIELLSDIRYQLTAHDQDRIQGILRGQIAAGDASFSIAPRKQSPVAQGGSLPARSCANSCAECRRHAGSCNAAVAAASA